MPLIISQLPEIDIPLPPSSHKQSARFVAIKTLCELHKTRKPVNALFNELLTKYPLANNDRQLATNIIFGLLRKRESLDIMLQQLCKQPLKKLKPFVHQALRVGLYQIIYLDRIPESAAVNESVKAVQAAHLPKNLHGFVNAVLRNAIRKRKELLPLPDTPDNPVLNHPQWLIQRWEKQYGHKETLRICQQNNEQAVFSIQINSCETNRTKMTELLTAQGITAHSSAYCESTLILDDFHGGVSQLPGFQEGYFQVQDQGAQLLAQLLAPMTPNSTYLDACAGLGGKTSVLAQLAVPVCARVYAVEPETARQEKFKENMKRLHPTLDIPLYKGSLQEFATTTKQRFQGILVDAPCSGTGVIGRHPDIRWNRRVDDFARYQKIQLELLNTAATLLAPQGLLIYATCSLEEEENKLLIQHFLAANDDFSLQNCRDLLPPAARKFVSNGFFAPSPDAEIDGFFGAVLVKSNPTQHN